MSENVQFEGDNSNYISTGSQVGGQSQYGEVRVRGMAGWLIRHGMAKSKSSADMILVGIAIVDFIVTVLVIKYFIL